MSTTTALRTLIATTGAEMRKVSGLPSAWFAAAFSLVITPVLAGLNGLSFRAQQNAGGIIRPQDSSTVDFGFYEVTIGVIAAIVIGVVIISSEYRADRGTISGPPQLVSSLAAVPRRHRLLVAKALSVAMVVGPLAAASMTLTIAASRRGLGSYAAPLSMLLVSRSLGAVIYCLLIAEWRSPLPLWFATA